MLGIGQDWELVIIVIVALILFGWTLGTERGAK